jgi:porin
MRSSVLVLTGLFLTHAVGAAETCADCDDRDALTVSATYTGEQWRQASGGLTTGSRYLDNLDITIDADAERIAGLEGMQVFAYLLYNNGHAVSDLTGAAQGISNIEATEALRLYELWTQWSFGAGEQSLRVGLYDLNSEFDSIESAGLFINPSHGIGPDLAQTGHNGPSIFPVTSLGARLMKSWGPWSAQMAVLDAVPGDIDRPARTSIRLSGEEGALMIGEANYRSAAARVGVGYWQYTADFERLDSSVSGESAASDANAGAYVIVERPVVVNESAHVDFFIRAGTANGRINPVDRYVGMGAVYTIVSNVREHRIGVSAAIAEFGEPFGRLAASAGHLTDARESIVEITYRVNVSEWLTLQPDIQYVRHPGADAQLDSAWVVGLRFELGAGWSWPR